MVIYKFSYRHIRTVWRQTPFQGHLDQVPFKQKFSNEVVVQYVCETPSVELVSQLQRFGVYMKTTKRFKLILYGKRPKMRHTLDLV